MILKLDAGKQNQSPTQSLKVQYDLVIQKEIHPSVPFLSKNLKTGKHII
jgi:hypothetical protein